MQRTNKRVSMMVVRRLPKYYQHLCDLKEKGIRTISSQALGELTGLTASQIRQDLNSFGAYGRQGKGYMVDHLLKEIRAIIGLEKDHPCIILGFGNLGRAIFNYERFRSEGMSIVGLFDVDDRVVGQHCDGLTVQHIDALADFLSREAVEICILSVPRSVGQTLADQVCELGIKGILNFVPLDLTVPEDVVVENVNITDSLFILSYLLNDEDLNESE